MPDALNRDRFQIPSRPPDHTSWLAIDDAAGNLKGAYVDENQRVQPASALAQSVALQEALRAAGNRWAGPAASK